MDGGAWWAVVHGVAQSRTRLKRLSSSSSSVIYISLITNDVKHLFVWLITFVVLFSQKGAFMSFFYWVVGFVLFLIHL